MRPDEIRAKAATLAELFAAKAAGKVCQIRYIEGWKDAREDGGPGMHSDLSRWRIKPEPRRMWEVVNPKGRAIICTLHNEAMAMKWKAKGMEVSEWQEVLP